MIVIIGGKETSAQRRRDIKEGAKTYHHDVVHPIIHPFCLNSQNRKNRKRPHAKNRKKRPKNWKTAPKPNFQTIFPIFRLFFPIFRLPKDPAVLKILRDSELLPVVFLLRPANLLRCEPLFEGENASKTQENCVSAGAAAIVDHCAIINLLRIV